MSLSRAAAALLAGFFLAAGLVGLVSWALPGPWQSTLVPGLVAFFPIWMGTAALAFAFEDAGRAWAWMGGLAALSLTALWLLQLSGLVR
ncbi:MULTISPECIES: hypothetical protein [Luteimonas]|uniref:hypothetical protein n=1 Tax=Luteimonas TaxID=83614 RepID=UPI000C7DE1A8|nr:MULTISPECIES: hypothetical protein [Luteimonas]